MHIFTNKSFTRRSYIIWYHHTKITDIFYILHWRFGGTDWHHFRAQFCYYHNMKVKSSSSSENSVRFYQTTRCHVRQESNIQSHRCENLSVDINFSSSLLMVPRAVHVEYVVKTGILCLIFLCALQICSIHIYLSLTDAIAASLNNTRKERRILTHECIYTGWFRRNLHYFGIR